MIEVTPNMVGTTPAPSWQLTLNILWETAFRVGDVMDFSWRNPKSIHPIWPDDRRIHPTLGIPGTQKNRKLQEIPMLPGLQRLLEAIPETERGDWVANPLPMDSLNQAQLRPSKRQLGSLCTEYSNIAIARAFDVTETTVRKWLAKYRIHPSDQQKKSHLPIDKIKTIQTGNRKNQSPGRLTKERVGRVISMIGREANIIVQHEDQEAKKRLKFASAHDIRRGCAERLINQGVSAETLKLILRHSNFSTTEKFYGAVKDAQAAADEIRRLSENQEANSKSTELSEAEIAKLKLILEQM